MARYVYLETAPESGRFNLRGEVGANDNPDSFAKLMLRSGLRSVFRADKLAKERDVTAQELGVE